MKMRAAQWIGIGGLVALGFLGCRNQPKDKTQVLVTVAGEKITEAQFKEVLKAVLGDEQKAEALLKNEALKEQRNQFLESLALQKSMIQKAKKEGMDKDPHMSVILEQRIAQVYFQALMEKRMPKAGPTDADLKAIYDGLAQEQKAAASQGQGQAPALPPFEEVKTQLTGVWRQKQEKAVSLALFNELKQGFPITFAEGYKPTALPPQP